MDSMPLCLGEHEDNHDEGKAQQRGVEPPEVSPADMSRHGTRDDGSYHERTHVHNPVQCVPLSTVVQEENIGNDCRLDRLCRTSANAVQTTDLSDFYW